MLELLGVREEQLGRMFESPEVTGWVNREAAALTGCARARRWSAVRETMPRQR